MKISIITVVLNGEKTISKAMESVGNQLNCDIEHIVIDGGSSDATLSLLEKYKDQIAILVSGPDRGIYDAMNKGIRLATGDVIGFLNSDDVYMSNEVVSLVSRCLKEYDVDAVYGDLEYFLEASPAKVCRTYRSDRFSPNKLSMGLMPAHPTLFLRRQVYQIFGLFDPSYRIGGDFEFIARIFRDEKIRSHYIPKVMVRMQLGGVSTSGLRSTLLLLKENLRACKTNGIPTSYFKLLTRYPGKLLEFFNI